MSHLDIEGENVEINAQSFIIKVWLDDSIQGVQYANWRGHITHVPSGSRKYFKSLDEIASIIQNYFFPLPDK